jgi:hypothetical protein
MLCRIGLQCVRRYSACVVQGILLLLSYMFGVLFQETMVHVQTTSFYQSICVFTIRGMFVSVCSRTLLCVSSLGCRCWTAFVNAIFALEPFAHDLLFACSNAILFARNSMVSDAFPSGSPLSKKLRRANILTDNPSRLCATTLFQRPETKVLRSR